MKHWKPGIGNSCSREQSIDTTNS